MSTISDALRKVQKQRAGEDGGRWHAEPVVNPLPPGRPREDDLPESVAGPPVAGIVLAVVLLVLGVSVAMMRCSRQGAAPVEVGVGQARAVVPTVPAKAPDQVAVASAAAGVTSNVADTGGVQVPPQQEGVKMETEVPVETPAETPPHKLVGIFYAEKNPVAIIDDFSLKEGETVGSYRVIRIGLESVTLKRAGEQEVVLRLK